MNVNKGRIPASNNERSPFGKSKRMNGKGPEGIIRKATASTIEW